MSYVSNTEENVQDMLRAIGISSISDLFSDIPDSVRLTELLPLCDPHSEIELNRHIRKLASKNIITESFTGAGSNRHYVPAAVDQLALRSEFYTAYTPYQPEISQGTLTAIFEYQTMICRLTGMDIANASMYDGATSLAEAVLMTVRANCRKKILLCDDLHPHYRELLSTYAWAHGLELITQKNSDGVFSPGGCASACDETVSAVIVQNPNFFGCLCDIKALSCAAHAQGAFLIYTVTEPLSLALLKPPGELGADIVCGEGQSFGNPAGFGGPCLGILAAKDFFTRKMPGRLVGKTADSGGKEAYVLTLQTREQHIRREKATSNICSNEGLCALRAAIYLSLAGKNLRPLAQLNHAMTSYLKTRLSEKGILPVFSAPFFNECAVRVR
ncbi:MAG: aminomethyl-transferring glycine dehydrogenase subunit GcvPA, partial [Spirochaetota bacterium]